MSQQLTSSVENNFTKGLITEATGLDFPENATTDTDNCEYTLIGDVNRRLGIDFETNFATLTLDRANKALSSYKWNNVGGDGLTQILAIQTGGLINFYSITNANNSSPISQNKLASTVTLNGFVAAGGTLDTTLECQFSDGNGYLFIYHPSCNPIYCTYTAGNVTAAAITIKVRDFIGIPEVGIPDKTRPLVLTKEHNYNLINQGWTSGAAWTATSATADFAGYGARAMDIQPGLSGKINVGDQISLIGNPSPYNFIF